MSEFIISVNLTCVHKAFKFECVCVAVTELSVGVVSLCRFHMLIPPRWRLGLSVKGGGGGGRGGGGGMLGKRAGVERKGMRRGRGRKGGNVP